MKDTLLITDNQHEKPALWVATRQEGSVYLVFSNFKEQGKALKTLTQKEEPSIFEMERIFQHATTPPTK